MSYICHIYHLLLLGSSTQILLLKIVLDFEMADSELTQEVRARTLSWLGWAHEVALSHPGTREESTLSKFFTSKPLSWLGLLTFRSFSYLIQMRACKLVSDLSKGAKFDPLVISIILDPIQSII